MKEFKQKTDAKIDQVTAKQNEFEENLIKVMQKQRMKLNQMLTLTHPPFLVCKLLTVSVDSIKNIT